MTKEEVEKAFGGVSPYYAYKQGIKDGITYNEESFRREAAKDILAGMLSNPGSINVENERLQTIEGFVNGAVMIADELIRQLQEGR